MPDVSKFKRSSDGAVFDIKDTTARNSIASLNIPSKTSDLTNDSSFVTTTEMNTAINTAVSGNFLVVAELPTTDISTHTIYLVPKTDGETGNVYTEYIYANNKWEKIGETTIDLSGYQPLLTFDDTPTSESTNPVKSGGVFTYVNTLTASRAPENHAATTTLYGAGTTANYGHTKVINDLTHSSYANGESLSAYQGYLLDQNKVAKSAIGTAAARDYTTSVTSGSSDLVTSGGAYTAIQNKQSAIKAVNATLTVAGWNNSEQTVTVSGATLYPANLVVGLAMSAEEEAIDAAGQAKLNTIGQTTNSITVHAYGDVPEVAIPITIFAMPT